MAELKRPSPKRYPPELRERAVRLVAETMDRTGARQGAVVRVARQLGIGTEALREWVKRAEVDGGRRPGVGAPGCGAAPPCSRRGGTHPA
jgi:transposase